MEHITVTVLLVAIISFTVCLIAADVTVSLTPTIAEVLEHRNTTLTCTVTDAAISYWYIPGRDNYVPLAFLNGHCYMTDPFNQTTFYSVSCRLGIFSVTILDVNRRRHGEKWICADRSPFLVDINSTATTIIVYVPVQNVTISINGTQGGGITSNENQYLTVNCSSSESRPNTSISLFVSTQNVTKSEVTVKEDPLYISNNDLWQTNQIFHFKPNRTFNNKMIYCNAHNVLGMAVISESINLNIKYPPENPPIIHNLQNGSHFSLIEGDVGRITCTTGESNPRANLSWKCYPEEFHFNVSHINDTSKTLSWISTLRKNTSCVCESTYERLAIRTAVVYLNHLYPAGNVTVNLSIGTLHEYSVKDCIKIIENPSLALKLICSATGNPEPDVYRWTGFKNLNNHILELNLTRNISGNYTCHVNNTMIPTEGVEQIGVTNRTYAIDILFPPVIGDLQNESVIEGRSFYTVCKVTPGNPSATSVWWKSTIGFNSETNVLFSPNVSRTHESVYVCIANNTMLPTYWDEDIRLLEEAAITNRSFHLTVLYPPEDLTADMKMESVHIENVSRNFSLTEDTSKSIILTCSAKSKPSPNVYSWYGHFQNNSDILVLKVTREASGSYQCTANNTMMPTNAAPEFGHIQGTYTIDILYPPTVSLTYKSVNEGEDVDISCVQIPGKITHQTIHWTSLHTSIKNNNSLIIRNVTRKHAGNYTCLVNYTMIPTYGESKSDSIVGVVYLDVFYKAELANFFVGQENQNQNVTVNEKDGVRMMCILDSNPNSTMQISVRNSIVASEKLTKTLEHYISQTSCNDAGVYTCSGYNFLNTIHSSRQLRIFVNCSPRQSSSTDVQQNFTISPDGTATFSFTTLAYPQPSFKWLFRPANSELIEAINGQNNTRMISENEMQINFTVTDVDTSDYGEYVLTINNTFGSYQQSFFLRVLQKESTYDGQNSPRGGGNAGPVAVGVIGGILGIGVIVTVVFLVRRRSHGKQLNAAKNSGDVSLSKVCQYEFKDDDCTVTEDGDTAHVYEQLQNSGSDRHYQQLTSIASKKKDGECTETKDGGKSNVYEKLHAAGFDQHYQQLKTVDLLIDKGQHIVYENLRIQRDTGRRNAEDELQ